MNINGAATPTTFYVLASAGEYWVISHLHITIAAAAAPAMGDFGSIAGGSCKRACGAGSFRGRHSQSAWCFHFQKEL